MDIQKKMEKVAKIAPDAATVEEVHQVIMLVCEKVAPKYKFGYYTDEDMVAEAYIIACSALDKYNGEHPLENFLSVHVRNRILSFRRDKYVRPNSIRQDIVESKKALMEGGVGVKLFDKSYHHGVAPAELDEIKTQVRNAIPLDLQSDYLKMVAGEKISSIRKKKILEYIWDVLDE